MKFKFFTITVLLSVGLLILLPVLGSAVTFEIGGGLRYNTHSMTELNQEVIAPFDDLVTDINDLISAMGEVPGSLSMPSEIHSGIGSFGEARLWLLPFMGVGFEIEKLAASSASSSSITVQTGAASVGTVDVDLGVDIKATGYSGEMLLALPLDFLKFVGKFAVGYYSSSLRLYASGSAEPSTFPYMGTGAPHKVDGNINLTYNGSGVGFKGLLGVEIPIKPVNLGLHFGYRFLKTNMGDITGDGNPNFLDFSGFVIGLGVGTGF